MNNILIKSKNLTVGYGKKILLKNADFEVKKGDIFVIMGGSGCGKSSLLKVLTGLMEPLNGSFELFGIDYGSQYTSYSDKTIEELVHLKLALVGLSGYEDYYPSEISGGMKKRAGLARALALDPRIVYFDEPSAGLDPISSSRLDELMLEISANLGTTLVVVTHELESIFTIANNSIYLDAETKTITASGNPHEILKNPPNERVFQFLTRGKNNEKGTE